MSKKQHIKTAREIKEDKVESLIEKLGNAKTVTFADFRGLGANQIADLRKKIKDAGGELIIEKNTLIKIALKSKNYKVEDDNLLTGPTAAIFAYQDEVAPIKELSESNKATGVPSFKFGFFENNFLDIDSVEKLSKIPGRDTLNAKLVGTLNSPIYGIVSVLSGNIRNLVYALNAIKEKKGV